MNKIQIPLTFCLLLIVCNCEYELKLEEINNLTLRSRRFEACRELDPDACCFKDNVKLKVAYDEKSIQYFMFTGTQVGKNCDDTLVVFPTKYSSTQKTIKQGSFSVTDIQGVFSYTFFSSYREYKEDGFIKADCELDARAPSQKYQLDQYFVFTKTLGKAPPSDSDSENKNDQDNQNNNQSASLGIIHQFKTLLFLIISFIIF